MYKVTIENLILKKGWDKFIPNFYDPYAAFFVVLQFGKEQSKELFTIKGANQRTNYVIKLGPDNTRFIKGESFEIDLKNKNQLWIQFFLVEDKLSSSSVSLESLEQQLAANTSIKKKNNLKEIGVIGFNLPLKLLIPKDEIIFKNKLLELTFYLTLKNERL
jgi:hypothetical protein